MQYSTMNVPMRPEVSVQAGVVHVTRTWPSSLVNIALALTSLGALKAAAIRNARRHFSMCCIISWMTLRCGRSHVNMLETRYKHVINMLACYKQSRTCVNVLERHHCEIYVLWYSHARPLIEDSKSCRVYTGYIYRVIEVLNSQVKFVNCRNHAVCKMFVEKFNVTQPRSSYASIFST